MINADPEMWEQSEPDVEVPGHFSGTSHYVRLDCRPAMQNYLAERFRAAQGPSSSDTAARARRLENARRYTAWANTDTSLSPTGQRPV